MAFNRRFASKDSTLLSLVLRSAASGRPRFSSCSVAFARVANDLAAQFSNQPIYFACVERRRQLQSRTHDLNGSLGIAGEYYERIVCRRRIRMRENIPSSFKVGFVSL
jgi:hypothetical protein